MTSRAARVKAALAVATSLAVAACGGASRPPTTGPAPATSAKDDASPQAPASSTPDDARAAALIAAMMKRVERARRLPAKTAVRGKTLARDVLLAQVKDHVKKEIPSEAVRGQGEMLVAFGLLPPAYDYEKGVFDLLEAQLAGYYEPADRTMYLAADLGAEDAEATLAHELVHALQDQHYDLGPQIAFQAEGGDKSSAIHALAEGDAMSAMMDVMMAQKGASALDLPDDLLALQMRAQVLMSPGTADVPPVLRSSLVAPYIDGMLFVHAQRRRGGWAAVDKAWRSPPTTTEQLLHPDKYDAREPALEVPQPPLSAAGGGFRSMFADLMGEQGLRLVLEEWAPREKAARAAAGWGGDRAATLVRSQGGVDEHMATWWIRFDGDPKSCPDALEAFDVIARAVQSPPDASGARQPGKVRHDRHTSPRQVCRDRGDLGPLVVAIAGCDVFLAGGPYARQKGAIEARSTCKDAIPWAEKTVSGR